MTPQPVEVGARVHSHQYPHVARTVTSVRWCSLCGTWEICTSGECVWVPFSAFVVENDDNEAIE